MRERPIRSLPVSILFFVVFGIGVQVYWHGIQDIRQATAQSLPAAPEVSSLRLLGFGDPVSLAKLLMLWLQAFDNQPGISVPFENLDYDKVSGWLTAIEQLDPRGQYPLLAASRLYTRVPDEAKQRQMLEFVYERFFDDPGRRWPWLAHATIIAKHRLEDQQLALKYSRAITDKSSSNGIPPWASQMQILILEDMGEFRAAQLLIGGLIQNGTIKDAKEVRFLNDRLEQLQRSQRIKPDSAGAVK